MMKYLFLIFISFGALTSYGQQGSDTLFFRYDKEYLINKESSPELLYPKDFQTNEGGIFFRKKGTHYNLDPAEILCLKEYLLSLKIRKNRFHDLISHLGQFKLFLVEEEKAGVRYIEITSGMKIY